MCRHFVYVAHFPFPAQIGGPVI